MQVVVGGGCDYYPGSATSSPSFTFAVSATCGSPARATCCAQLERLRRQLAAEGLLEPQKRLRAPAAAAHDRRRHRRAAARRATTCSPGCAAAAGAGGWCGRFAPVQDRHAAPAIAAALRDLAAIEEVEVVIVARGGGSLADLFAFCDEALCRTVALLRVPVIASVGHHTDRTLIDDVAAVCCSTPTHAAEAAVPIDCRRRARGRWCARPRRLAGTAAARSSSAPARSAQLSRAPAPARRRATAASCTSCCASCARAPAARATRAASLADAHCWCCSRTAARAHGVRRAPGAARELERLALALAAHDPERTLARGYALVRGPRRRAARIGRGGPRGARAAAALPRRVASGASAWTSE